MLRRSTTSAGFSLVEAMVTLVVLSVGMIGIARFYGQGLGAGRTALYRTLAVNLAADMADRIRVNRLAGSAYDGRRGEQRLRPLRARRRELHAGADGRAPTYSLWHGRSRKQLPGGAGTVASQPALRPASRST